MDHKRRELGLTLKQKIKPWRILRRSLYVSYFLLIILFIVFHLYYADRVLPNTYVNGIDIGGLKSPDAVNLLSKNTPENPKATIKIKDYTRDIDAKAIIYRALSVATVKNAFAIGRSGKFGPDIKTKILSFLNETDLKPKYEYDENALKSFASLITVEALDEYTNPKFTYNDGKVEIIDGKPGEAIDEPALAANILNGFIKGESKIISPTVKVVAPDLTRIDLIKVATKMEVVMKNDYVLTFEDKEWKLEKPEVLNFVVAVKNPMGIVDLGLNKSAVMNKLSAISKEIDRNPKGQTLDVKDNRVVSFTASENGQRLKIKESYDNIDKGLLNGTLKIALAVDITTPPASENQYQITDILGEGKSQFRGSDSGRLHNIENAVSKVNGVLIAPGDIYSFDEAVGPIDKDHGFSQARVISGGRTVLGDGGGVCQVSTTVFRAALNAGLPIVERNAHAYRVGYYEQDSPPGLDATIYSPSVDLKFKNDTAGYVLVAAVLDKANYALKFTIYGKKDGRTVEVSTPKVLSSTPAPATVYEDDPNAPKGSKKQLEHSVAGAVVVFDRVVKKGEQVLYNDTFKSNYRAWAAVYSIGTKE